VRLGYRALPFFVALVLAWGVPVEVSAAGAKASQPQAVDVMVEGTLVRVAGSTLTLATPPVGPYCAPGTFCPQFVRAGETWLVLASSADVFGNYASGRIPFSALRPSAEVVVAGATLHPASPGWAPAQEGVIRAAGIFLLSRVVAGANVADAARQDAAVTARGRGAANWRERCLARRDR
jgi:hypothetical protein